LQSCLYHSSVYAGEYKGLFVGEENYYAFDPVQFKERDRGGGLYLPSDPMEDGSGPAPLPTEKILVFQNVLLCSFQQAIGCRVICSNWKGKKPLF